LEYDDDDDDDVCTFEVAERNINKKGKLRPLDSCMVITRVYLLLLVGCWKRSCGLVGRANWSAVVERGAASSGWMEWITTSVVVKRAKIRRRMGGWWVGV
jgi:hypothetical protein